jgi:hypothetical protein
MQAADSSNGSSNHDRDANYDQDAQRWTPAARGLRESPSARPRGGAKHYDTQDSVKELGEQGVTPHVAPNTRPRGYASRQKKRQQVEELFDWWQRIGRLRKVRQRGRELVKGMFPYTRAAYHLMRMTKLLGATA